MSILLFYYPGKFASHCSEEVLLRCVYYLKGDRKASVTLYTGCFFHWYKKVNQARLGVSWPIYVAVDSPNLGFPYFNFLGGYQLKKHPVQFAQMFEALTEQEKLSTRNLSGNNAICCTR